MANGDETETSVVKIEFPHQVMIEKWMLVLLIVGCTSLLFLICFPIDFCLYRRRKRLSRARKNSIEHRKEGTPQRAAQYHVKEVTVIKESDDADYQEINESEKRKYHAQRGVVNFLRLLKKKQSAETLEFHERLAETSMTEESLDLPAQTMTETEIDIADSYENIYQETAGKKTSYKCVNELTESSKDNSVYYDVYDDYLEYTPRKKDSKVSRKQKENHETYKYKNKRSHLGVRYDQKVSEFGAQNKQKKSYTSATYGKKKSSLGGFEPLENMTNDLEDTNKKHCFTVQMHDRNEGHLEPVNNVNGSVRNVVHNNKEIQREVNLENYRRSSAKKRNEDDIGVFFSRDNRNRRPSIDPVSKDAKGDTDLLFETVFNADDKRFKRRKMLTHSLSEHYITTNSNHSNRVHVSGRKKNAVSPVNKNTPGFSQENKSSDKTTPFSIPVFTEYSATSKPKKKNIPFLQEKCCDSMPELHCEKEKY